MLLSKLPEVVGVSEARHEIAHILEEVSRGGTFIVKGPKGKEAVIVSADSFRRLQEAYTELVGELETIKILQDEKAVAALREVSEDDAVERYTLAEVESMVISEDER